MTRPHPIRGPMNTYSEEWFDTFLRASDPPSVEHEIAFCERHLPPSDFPRLLDVACGIGRHARALAERGYEVLGLDASDLVIAIARDAAPPGATFVCGDMRRLDSLASDYDGVLCLWQSFGNFSDEENGEILSSMGRRLRPGGRLLIDVYNRDALGALPPESVETRHDREVSSTRSLDGDRFRVRISYARSDAIDEFEWQVFTPEALGELAERAGLAPVLTCAWFDDDTPAAPEHVRMQALFERAAGPTADAARP